MGGSRARARAALACRLNSYLRSERRNGTVRDELVEAVLRVVEAIPPGSAATYGMIARAIGTGPRIVGRIMHEWGGGVPWWRVVNVHGTFPTTVREDGLSHWVSEGMPHDFERGKLLLDECVVGEEWLDNVARTILDELRKSAEMSDSYE